MCPPLSTSELTQPPVFQSRGGGSSLATAVLEDEVLAEQGEEASLLSGCRALLRSVTKVSYSSRVRQHLDKTSFPNVFFFPT